MLKEAVVGGPSLVFSRKHKAGETAIRSHKYSTPKLCRRVLGFDANALYPSTMRKPMPCGEGKVVPWWQEGLETFETALNRGEWFGFAEVDIEVPPELWEKFEELPPLFYNKPIPDAAVTQHMKDYLQTSGWVRFPEQKKLVGVLLATKILLYAPLLQWYLSHELRITAVHRMISYKPRRVFKWFVEKATENRRKGDTDPDKALLAKVFKLLGNSAYGKLIEAVERRKTVKFTKTESTVVRLCGRCGSKILSRAGDAFEIEIRKNKL